MHHRELAFCLALTLMGCSQPQTTSTTSGATNATNPSNATTTVATTTTTAPAVLSSSDETLLKDGAADSMAELQAGELAVRQASSPEVKAIGEMLVKDHTRTGSELQKLATKKNVQLPTEVTGEWKDTLGELQKLHGTQFDQEFLEEMLEHLRKDVDSYSKAAQSATDPEVKQGVETALVITRMHLDKATRLADKRDIKGD